MDNLFTKEDNYEKCKKQNCKKELEAFQTHHEKNVVPIFQQINKLDKNKDSKKIKELFEKIITLSNDKTIKGSIYNCSVKHCEKENKEKFKAWTSVLKENCKKGDKKDCKLEKTTSKLAATKKLTASDLAKFEKLILKKV
jgi:hypothetical protein